MTRAPRDGLTRFFRTLFLVSAVMIAMVAYCSSAAAAEPGPVAAFPFDEGAGSAAQDSAGLNPGTLSGAEWAEGKYGLALFFGGEHQCVTVPEPVGLEPTTGLTVEAWIRPEGIPSGTIIEKRGAAGPTWWMGFGSTGYQAQGEIRGPKTSSYLAYPSKLPKEVWSFVTLTYDGAHTVLRVNGSKVESSYAEGFAAGPGPLTIGCGYEKETSISSFNGEIDNVRIYSRALTETELNADKEAPLLSGGPAAPPVASYTLDEGTGSVANDLSGSHTATLAGGAGWTEGKYGSAVSIPTESSCATTASSPGLELREAFTLEAWVKPGRPKITASILSVGEVANGRIELYLGQNEPKASGSALGSLRSNMTLPANQWSFVTLTDTGSKDQLYVNNVLKASGTNSGPNPRSLRALHIGCGASGPGSGAIEGGDVDNVRVYNRALTQTEIAADQLNDGRPPEIELSGPLTEGLKAGVTSYELHVHAIDGKTGFPGVGVKTVTIAVDGQQAETRSQPCTQGSCSLDLSWIFETAKYGSGPHDITVSAEDQGGLVATVQLPLPAPSGSVPACSLSGPQAENPPDEVQTLAGGGKNSVYHGAEGEKLNFRSPPAGFDPKTATEAELELYGIPPRPVASEVRAREAWNETVGQVGETVKPGGCMMVATNEFAPAPRFSFGPHHSGYFAYDPTGPANHWRAADTQFIQPALTHTCSGAAPNKKLEEEGFGAGTSAWVGLGGTEDKGFFQAGTNQPYGYYDAHGNRQFNVSSFWEFFRAGHETRMLKADEEPVHTNLEIAPGDHVFSKVVWSLNKQAMLMYVRDLDTHKFFSVEVAEPENLVYDGREVSFVGAERPNPGELQNFGSITLTGNEALVTGKGWAGLESLGHLVNLRMQEENKEHGPSGQVMASNSGLFNAKASNAAAFTTTWQHCHP